MRILIALALLVCVVPDADAQYRPGWRQYCTNYGHCEWRRVRVYEPRVYGYERRRDDDDDNWSGRHNCRDTRKAVGDQHLTVDGAKKAANDAWAGTVRFHLGEKFMDLNNAARIIYTCSRSSIKEAGASVTTLGQAFTRCEIAAQPCEAQHQPGEREDR